MSVYTSYSTTSNAQGGEEEEEKEKAIRNQTPVDVIKINEDENEDKIKLQIFDQTANPSSSASIFQFMSIGYALLQ